MGYYTRVLTKRDDWPALDQLAGAVHAVHARIALTCDDPDPSEWESLLLSHPDGPEIAAIERNVVAPGALAEAEIGEFIEAIGHCKPATAVPWLTSFLRSVKVIYAFRHLSGTEKGKGFDALSALREAIWRRGEAILQADAEGFSNEAGDHILWQFSDGATGPWRMAVLKDGAWVSFKMDLGNPKQRAAFLEGRVL